MQYSISPTVDDTNHESLVSLNAEKVFDRDEWYYPLKALNFFNFCPKFMSWVKILYTLPIAAVRTNVFISTYFKLQRGMRQGCPLSPLLSAITMEHKVSLYANDMFFFLSDPGFSNS